MSGIPIPGQFLQKSGIGLASQKQTLWQGTANQEQVRNRRNRSGRARNSKLGRRAQVGKRTDNGKSVTDNMSGTGTQVRNWNSVL